jgi:hypothetical protein
MRKKNIAKAKQIFQCRTSLQASQHPISFSSQVFCLNFKSFFVSWCKSAASVRIKMMPKSLMLEKHAERSKLNL